MSIDLASLLNLGLCARVVLACGWRGQALWSPQAASAGFPSVAPIKAEEGEAGPCTGPGR